MRLLSWVFPLIFVWSEAIAQAGGDGTSAAHLLQKLSPSIAYVSTSFFDENNPSNTCGQRLGKGFVLTSGTQSVGATVLTAKHVVAPPNDDEIKDCPGFSGVRTTVRIGRTGSGEVYEVSGAYLADDADAAVLRLPIGASVVSLPICSLFAPTPGTEFIIVGSAGGLEAQIHPYQFTAVKDRGVPYWIGSSDLGKGDGGVSGSPVFDNASGSVVGIYTSSVDDSSSAHAVTPVSSINAQDILQKAGVTVASCQTAESNADNEPNQVVVVDTCNDWLDSEQYISCFTSKTQEGFYPYFTQKVVTPDGSEYQHALWLPYPNANSFCFNSCSSMSDDKFASLNSQLEALGMRISFRSTSQSGNGSRTTSATWTGSLSNCRLILAAVSCSER